MSNVQTRAGCVPLPRLDAMLSLSPRSVDRGRLALCPCPRLLGGIHFSRVHPKNIFDNLQNKGNREPAQSRFNSVAGFGGTYKNYMNRTTLSLFCITTLALSAAAQQE